MIAKKRISRLITVVLALVMVFSSAVSVFADAPDKEDVEYKGSGRVEVEFHGRVAWKNPKVTVTDQDGKTYTAKIIEKDNDEIEFRINNYKEGKKYTFKITGARAKGTSGYGTVKGKVSIPKAKTAKTTTIAKSTAKDAAIKNAVSAYKMDKATMRDYDIEKDTYKGKKVWEVSFEAKRTGQRGWFEFEYKIDVNTGKILAKKVERD